MTTDTAPGSTSELRRLLTGSVVGPDETGWDRARTAWNLAADQCPNLVVHAETAEDVLAVVRHAARRGMRVAPQATGHGATALPELGGTILLRTDRMTQLELDVAARRIRVGAGVRWQEVSAAAAPHGLAGLAGTSPGVGVVGYTLGGGLGWLGRRYGLAANRVCAVELVTGDGRVTRATADGEPELFWALRGGGGNFGVVTALEFSLVPVAEVLAGTLFFPLEAAREVLQGWREWTETVPDTVTSIARVLAFPDFPGVPDHLRSRSFTMIEVAILTGEPEGEAVLRPLRRMGPVSDTVRRVAASALGQLHRDPLDPTAGLDAHRLLRELPLEALDRFVDLTGPAAASPLISVELRHLGGALGRSDPAHGVLDRLDADFAMYAVGAAAPAEQATRVRHHLDALDTAMAPWDAGRSFLNFRGQPDDAERLFGPKLPRLRTIRADVDPDGIVLANHRLEGPPRLPRPRIDPATNHLCRDEP